MSGRRSLPNVVCGWAIVFGLLAAGSADACPVCYGETDSPMAAAADASILFMAILTYGLIISAGVAFVLIRRQALRRNHQARSETADSATAGPGTADPAWQR